MGIAEPKIDDGSNDPFIGEYQYRTESVEKGQTKPVLLVSEPRIASDRIPLYLDWLHREGFEGKLVQLQTGADIGTEICEKLEFSVGQADNRFRGCIWEIDQPSSAVIQGIRQISRQRKAPKIILICKTMVSRVFVQSAIRAGADDVLVAPIDANQLVLTLWKVLSSERQSTACAPARAHLFSIEEQAETVGPLLVAGPRMREIAETVRKIAPQRTTVLLLGESGVGKDVVCQALHQCGPRHSKPLVAVNCGAIPKGLLESELFGHVRGAFTDASEDRVGLFEQAHEGTIFLDEIGDLPLSLQVRLLRVLQDGEIRPVGGTGVKHIDVRVVAATSKNLPERVESGEFRQDLYYRINVVTIKIPPLKERREEILLLANHCLKKLNHRLARKIAGLTQAARLCLVGHDWPGNVRELENTLEYAAVMATDEWIDTKDLPTHVLGGPSSCSFTLSLTIDGNDLSIKRAHHAIERELIVRALEQTSGNRTHAARLLELSHRALLYKIRAFGLT